MSQTIAHELTDRLRQHRGHGAGTIEAGDERAHVAIDVEESERYAVGVRGVSVRPHQPIGDVREAADRLVERVQSLDDPLRVVECDTGQGRAIVRSAEPHSDEQGVTYWEADVHGDGVSLNRYRKDHSAPDREIVAEPLPHGVVGQVAEQIIDATGA